MGKNIEIWRFVFSVVTLSNRKMKKLSNDIRFSANDKVSL